MKTIISICIALFFTFVCACERVEENYLSENVEYAAAQYDLLIEKLEKNGKPWAPRTVDTKGNIVYARNVWDWTSGFFAGSLWYLYNLTGDEKWKTLAKKYTEALKQQQYITSHHDIGFIIGCSYLNGMRMGRRHMIQLSCKRPSPFPLGFVLEPELSNHGIPVQDGRHKEAGSVLLLLII